MTSLRAKAGQNTSRPSVVVQRPFSNIAVQGRTVSLSAKSTIPIEISRLAGVSFGWKIACNLVAALSLSAQFP
jgi:hypothetical protein